MPRFIPALGGAAVVVLATVLALNVIPLLGPGASPTPPPTASPRPSTAPGSARFDSAIHGISIDYPAHWQLRPASEPWTGGPLGFDSRAADVIFDPELGARLYLVLASQRLLPLSGDTWRSKVLEWTCPGGGPMWAWHVDGVYSWQQHGDSCNSGSIAYTDTRGYLIRLVGGSEEPGGLAENYGWDWLKVLLDTVELRPEDAVNTP